MFESCVNGFEVVSAGLDEESRTLDLYESGSVLRALFQLLHSTLAPFVPPKSALTERDFTRIQGTFPEATVPFPLLPALFALADKYALSQDIVRALRSHLAAYASAFPLQVYGCAVTFGLDEVAGEASAHLLHPPLTSYTADEIKVIPTAEAYHELVLLHERRIQKLKEVLGDEQIFPYGYGECKWHAQSAKTLWQQRKTVVMSKIQAGETMRHVPTSSLSVFIIICPKQPTWRPRWL